MLPPARSPELKTHWNQQGYLVLPEFLDATAIASLQAICDRILSKLRQRNAQANDITNIAFLTSPQYFENHADELVMLLEFIADSKILELIENVTGETPLFHNTQYFPEPLHHSWEGAWHRDCQFGADSIAAEQARMRQVTGLHFRVAFEPDEQLEYVPGSEARWDTPEEQRIRLGANPTRPDMPDRQRIHLNPGDACLFNAWGIHRGTYRSDRPRRTLDLIYGIGGPCDWAVPAPTCFTKPEIVNALSDRAQAFFQRFIDAYAPFWE